MIEMSKEGRSDQHRAKIATCMGKQGSLFHTEINSEEDIVIKSKIFINSAGLYSEKVANNLDSLNKDFINNVEFAKGHYLKYHGKNPFSRLIYPLPSENGLGIHSTIDMDGQLKFGPDVLFIDKIGWNEFSLERLENCFPFLFILITKMSLIQFKSK